MLTEPSPGWSATLTLGLVPVSPSLRRKRDEGCYSCTTASPLVGRALDWTKLKCLLRLCPFAPASLTGTDWNKDSGARCYSGATPSAGSLLAGYLFHHLLLHFLRCGFCDAKTIGASPTTLYLLTKNADKTVAKAVKLGAASKGPVMDMFWGDRCGTVVDPEGYTWMVATHTARTLRHFRPQH